MKPVTVYVELLGEGVDVWRPADAEDLGEGRVRLMAVADDSDATEAWAFPPGTVVRCEPRLLNRHTVLVATERA